MSILTIRVLLLMLGTLALFSFQIDLPVGPLDTSDAENIRTMVDSAQLSEWLGPLAPIAISPFFGITLLAGATQFGPEWMGSNSLISGNPVLNNPIVFWVFLALTIVTSIPRFTKVSKPAAQAIDQLETYAGIITVIVIRVMSSFPEADSVDAAAMLVVQMSVFAFSADVLFALAAIVNIFVINTVKFFFEVMIWLVPFPFIDGLLELANKSLCAALMAVYLWSPTTALILNLILFLACLVAFRWVQRRVTFLRSVLWDPLWSMISKGHRTPRQHELMVFPQTNFGPFAAKAKLRLRPDEDGWSLIERRLILAPIEMTLADDRFQLQMQTGMMLNCVVVRGESTGKLLFSKRYTGNMETLAGLLNVELLGADSSTDPESCFVETT